MDRIAVALKCVVIVGCLAGSVIGILRIRESRREQECMAAAIEWLDLGNRLADQTERAKADPEHPTRGLVAVSNAVYRAIDAQLKGGL